MTGNINELSKYSQEDSEKSNLIKKVFREFYPVKEIKYSKSQSFDVNKSMEYSELIYEDINFDITEKYSKMDSKEVLPGDLKSPQERIRCKYCPECGRRYPKGENVCMECLVHLKYVTNEIDVYDIQSNPQFTFKGRNDYESFEELLDAGNLLRVNEFDFTIDDYFAVLHEIKSQAFMNFDSLVKENEIDFDELNIVEKIILFSKSFVKVDYKSSGSQLGYFESGAIFIDDRQTKSLQITTLIHELSHFLIQEILIHIICKLLDCSRNSFVQSLAAFILSYTHFTQLIDEYAAHNVEGRFTLFGFQDYSSFAQIEQRMDGEMTAEEIEITKSIGNTFALSIKDILESLIDRQLREDIKEQFLKDVVDRPNYRALEMENCQILNDEGFIKAIWLILNEGCEIASMNIDELISIREK